MSETKITTDLIVEEYGRIYQQRGQGQDRIKRALIQKSETLEKYATHKRITDDVYEMANDTFQPVLQPFRVPFEPTGGVKFHPNKIELQHIKVDLKISPDQIIDGWLGFLEGEGVDRSQWPITRYMVEVYLKQQIDYDREMNAVYFGVRDDNGTIPSTCMDGIRKKLIDNASSSYPVNVIHGIGRLDEHTVLDQVEAFSKAFAPIYQNHPIVICVSPEFKRAFLENKRAAGYYWLNGPEDINSSVDFTKQVVMGLPCMSGSTDMFAFSKGNLLWLTRKDKFNFDVQKEDRFVKILGDWREAIGFGVNKMVWTSAETVGGTSIDTSNDPRDGIVLRKTSPIRLSHVNYDGDILTGKVLVSADVLGWMIRNQVLSGSGTHAVLSSGLVAIPTEVSWITNGFVSESEYVEAIFEEAAGESSPNIVPLDLDSLVNPYGEDMFDAAARKVEYEIQRIVESMGEEAAERFLTEKYGSEEDAYISISKNVSEKIFDDLKTNGYLEIPFQISADLLHDWKEHLSTSERSRISAAVELGTDLYVAPSVPVSCNGLPEIRIDAFDAVIVGTGDLNITMRIFTRRSRSVSYGVEYVDLDDSEGVVNSEEGGTQSFRGFASNEFGFSLPAGSYKLRGYAKSSGVTTFTQWTNVSVS